MKYFVRLLLILLIITFAIGFYLKHMDKHYADIVIGIAVMVFAFILMPAFLIHRSKKRKLSDYALTKDKVDKIIDNLKI